MCVCVFVSFCYIFCYIGMLFFFLFYSLFFCLRERKSCVGREVEKDLASIELGDKLDKNIMCESFTKKHRKKWVRL